MPSKWLIPWTHRCSLLRGEMLKCLAMFVVHAALPTRDARNLNAGKTDPGETQVELLATPISPASKVLAMWEDQVSQTVAAHSGAPQKAPAAAEAAEMPAGVTGSWSVAPLIVEVNGGTLSDKSTSRTRNGAGIVDSGRWGGAGVGKAKKKARASEKGNGGSNNDPDLAAARARGSTEEWAKESEEHESKRVAWAEEEQMWRARLDALRVEEEARTGQTKMVLAQLAAVMGKSMYDMQKTQEQSFALMHQRTTALCARVTAASDRLAAGLTPQWFASKAAAAAAARTEVSELREQEARLTKEVGALGDALAQHSADLKKVRALDLRAFSLRHVGVCVCQPHMHNRPPRVRASTHRCVRWRPRSATTVLTWRALEKSTRHCRQSSTRCASKSTSRWLSARSCEARSWICRTPWGGAAASSRPWNRV